MEGGASGPRAQTAAELKEQIETERLGRPFLVYRDRDGEQRIHVIEGGVRAVGRSQRLD